MRIQIHKTDQIICDLVTTIKKDPLSMDAWKCTHINIFEHLPEGVLSSDVVLSLIHI